MENNNVPEWEIAPLSELTLHPQYGWTTSAKRDGNGLKLLRTTDISSGTVDWSGVPFCQDEPPQAEKYLLKDGDILVSRAGSVGLSYYVTNPQNAVFASYLIRFQAKENVIKSKYLYYFFQSPTYWDSIGAGKAGIAIPNVNATKLGEIQISYPKDLQKQEEIIKTLDDLLPQVQFNVKKIKRVKKILHKFRQAVLTAAVTGKLTEDWRERNLNAPKSKIEYKNINSKPKVQFDISHFDLFDLPDGWEWKQFWEAAEIKSNLVNPNDYPEYVLVAPDNIEKETGRLLEKKLVKDIKPISAKHLFFKGQIVYSKIRPYLSKLILADFDGVCSADMYPVSSRINSQYLMTFMLSTYFLDNISNLGTRTLLPKTNQEELNSVPVSIPPLEEQEEIVKKVNFYLGLASQIERQVEKADKKVSKLTQAILAKTFKSE